MYRAHALTRGIAAAIDGAAMLVLLTVAQVIVAVYDNVPGARDNLAAIVPLALVLLYSATEVFFAASPGKFAMGLRIACTDSNPAGFWTRLLRWSTKFYSLHVALIDVFFPGTLLMYVGGLSNALILCGLLGALNDDRMTFHDQWSGTAVWKRASEIPTTYLRATT